MMLVAANAASRRLPSPCAARLPHPPCPSEFADG